MGERTGGRPATDPAPLSTARHITSVDGGEPADGAPTRRQLSDVPPVDSAGQPTAVEEPIDASTAGPTGEEQEPPKRCRGCQAQLAGVCPGCGQTTSAYCGACRRDQPHSRQGQPRILANGLPRLRPGELPQLVAQVMRDNRLPEHRGIAGWTASRIAVYLPGRSTGAIGQALDTLARAGTAQLIGEQPARYQLASADAEQADSTDN
ncbi:hypothetical protein EV384_4647 [Micromonospora kangleipakensis]|uniref:Uncharacterized protein n=1 Tax=Micromonospora kangleipakensis TaxID=1077942 RepID=A0A4Q8BDS8_9ACTN|nr:hypothetical protein [Micromonospora kangleipakensis]RZU76050.1 hypothetical protein EV384_4647 [Micromonospora kangleipakensis]